MKAPLAIATTLAVTLLVLLGQTGCRFRKPVEPKTAADLTLCSADEIAADGGQGCDVVLEPYPRYDEQDALVFNDLPVQLFFYSQTPPEGTEVMGPIRARGVMGFGRGDCREAGISGLQSLQRLAVRNDADAVVNIRATWDGEPLGDELTFGCRRLRDRYALIWEGALARVPAPTAPDPATADSGDEPGPGDPADMGEETAAKLRKLQNLYYQGLITREEFLERRQEILNEI